jgi:hypothetical protein
VSPLAAMGFKALDLQSREPYTRFVTSNSPEPTALTDFSIQWRRRGEVADDL